jgi:hypothetical protein
MCLPFDLLLIILYQDLTAHFDPEIVIPFHFAVGLVDYFPAVVDYWSTNPVVVVALQIVRMVIVVVDRYFDDTAYIVMDGKVLGLVRYTVD